jgi:hypothetical protein
MTCCLRILSAALACAWLLSGCSEPPPKKVVVTNVQPNVRQGFNQGELLAGISQFISLEKTLVKDESGQYQFMGFTKDKTSQAGDQSAGFVVGGKPEEITSIVFMATLPPEECAKADKAPEWVQRNLRIQRQFLSNLFKDKVPDDVTKAAEGLKDKPDQEQTVKTDKGMMSMKYTTADKKVMIKITLGK